jgi:hypothetical protein
MKYMQIQINDLRRTQEELERYIATLIRENTALERRLSKFGENNK